ncbi:classical arabinogalactan protein 1-like [Olea europaea var. sylvestris]|uniref:Uncharacterized protein n=1 Tax=Olea europaea subsp. europaea TaxID=158383 RepID=A0A8S0QWP0_OLEEU|nr:classical arabinogalactan protein 1-like [Olea europaea var. sylvestris]CAA2970768.1 Hypothetical predicted protein [Olea europaea subsp. europaea]
MAASFIQILSLTLIFTVIFAVQSVVAVDPPEYSPSPQRLGDDFSPSPATPSISPSVADSSPPAPPPSDSSTAPSPVADENFQYPSPVPAPEISSDVNHANQADFGNVESNESSGGMKSGHKAGIALGVILFACVIGIGTIVYKKRQQNIRRSQYGYGARREFL